MLQLNKVLNLFRPREKFLIFNVEPNGSRSILVGVDEDKKLHLEKFGGKFKLPSYLKSFSKKPTAIITLHPDLGAVRIVPFHFIRQTAIEPLEITELENFLAQLAQKVFLELRGEVAKELDMDELNILLLESKPFAYRADGSSVSSPLGHKSREIHGFLELLFTTRDAFSQLGNVLYSGNPIFLTLHDKSELMSLQKIGKKQLVFLECSEKGSRLLEYDLSKKEILRRKSINWSPSRFFTRLEELWNVDRDIAETIYNQYLKDGLSERLRAQIEKIWKEEIAELFSALKKAGAKSKIYLKTPLVLPVSYPAKQKGITLEEFPVSEVFSKLGFTFDPHFEELGEMPAFTHLAPLLECYYDNSDNRVSHSLRRRIHWLIS